MEPQEENLLDGNKNISFDQVNQEQQNYMGTNLFDYDWSPEMRGQLLQQISEPVVWYIIEAMNFGLKTGEVVTQLQQSFNQITKINLSKINFNIEQFQKDAHELIIQLSNNISHNDQQEISQQIVNKKSQDLQNFSKNSQTTLDNFFPINQLQSTQESDFNQSALLEKLPQENQSQTEQQNSSSNAMEIESVNQFQDKNSQLYQIQNQDQFTRNLSIQYNHEQQKQDSIQINEKKLPFQITTSANNVAHRNTNSLIQENLTEIQNKKTKKSGKQVTQDFTKNRKKVTIDQIIEAYQLQYKQHSNKLRTYFEKIRNIVEIYESELSQNQILSEIIDNRFKPIKLISFEDQYLEYLEKSHFNLIPEPREQLKQPKAQITEDILCAICNDGDYQDHNLIVICSQCNTPVHQKCYVIDHVPQGDWICDICQQFAKDGMQMPCPLCPCTAGALKSTNLKISDPNCEILLSQLNPDYWNNLNKIQNKLLISKDKKKQQEENEQSCQKNPQIKNHQLYSSIQQEPQIENNISKPSFPKNKKKINTQQDSDLLYDFEKNQKTLINQPPNYPYFDQVWVHISCARFSKEFHFEKFRKHIQVRIQPKTESQALEQMCCIICEKTNLGIYTQCNFAGCDKYFHVECCRRQGYFFDIPEEKNKKDQIFCKQHTPLKLRRILQQNQSHTASEIYKFLTNFQSHLTHQKKQDCWEDNETQNYQELTQEQIKQYQQFMNRLKDYHQKLPINQFYIEYNSLKSDSSKYKIAEHNIPTRHRNKILQFKENDPIWRNFKFKKFSKKQMFKIYQDIIMFEKQEKKVQEDYQKKAKLQHEFQKSNRTKFQSQVFSSGLDLEEQDFSIYCICKELYKPGEDMMQCETCDNWYHYHCVGYLGTHVQAEQIDFFCMRCQAQETFEVQMSRCVKMINQFGSIIIKPYKQFYDDQMSKNQLDSTGKTHTEQDPLKQINQQDPMPQPIQPFQILKQSDNNFQLQQIEEEYLNKIEYSQDPQIDVQQSEQKNLQDQSQLDHSSDPKIIESNLDVQYDENKFKNSVELNSNPIEFGNVQLNKLNNSNLLLNKQDNQVLIEPPQEANAENYIQQLYNIQIENNEDNQSQNDLSQGIQNQEQIDQYNELQNEPQVQKKLKQL